MSSAWETGVTLRERTTFDGLVTAAHWSFAGMTVDSSRDRWAYGTPGELGIVPVAPTVTFGGQTIYFDTNNTAQVGLNPDDGPSPRQPRIAVTNIEALEWEQVAWSREVWIADYETSTGMAKLTMGYDGVGWTFLSVICRTTDKNVHPTPIRRSCSRWSTPRCGSRWN